MSAAVIDFRVEKARRIALARAAVVRGLVEELASAADTKRGRELLCEEYARMGWARDSDLKLAMDILEGLP